MAMQAVPATLTLVSDTDTLVLRPVNATAGDPIVCTQWDLGAPAVRDSSVDRPGADGTLDRSAFTGARSVSFDLIVFGDGAGSPYSYVERLAAMTHPSVRTVLRMARGAAGLGQSWEMLLRGNPYSLAVGRAAAAKLELQLQFTAPLGYLEGDYQSLQSVTADATDANGFTFPLSFPLSTGSTSASNPILAVPVGGSVPVMPTFLLYGPSVNPEIRDDQGNRFKFAGLTLGDGQFVKIDMGAATVTLNGSLDATVYHLVDFSVSNFWTWRPGTQTVRYIGTSGSVAVQWRDRRYSI